MESKGECVFRALHNALPDTSIDRLKADFKYGEHTFENGDPIPPSVHEIMDYFMEIGVCITPISRRPMSEHGGRVFYDFDPDIEAERWQRYLRSYNGFLIGRTAGGTGHMVWLERGIVFDGDYTYHVSECGLHAFYPDTFLVLIWQA